MSATFSPCSFFKYPILRYKCINHFLNESAGCRLKSLSTGTNKTILGVCRTTHTPVPLTHCRSSGPVCRNLNFFTVTLIFFEAMLQYKMFNMYNLIIRPYITYLVDIVSYNYVFFPPSWMPQPHKNIESCF